MKWCEKYDIIYETDTTKESVIYLNISEFAKVAEVSKSAVSRYFNNGYLSDEKREKIESAIKETGYAPSLSAQSVRTRVTKLIGVIIPKLSSESCARVAEGISNVLSENGYEMLLVNTANDYNKEFEYLELFRKNRVDGVIFLASVFTPLHKTVLNKMHIPVVVVGQSRKGLNCVCHDDFGAAYSLTKLMLKKGAKNPAYIGVTTDDKAAGQERHDGFFMALDEFDMMISSKNCAVSKFTIDSGYEQAKRIFSDSNKPDAIFCATDNIAAGVMRYCAENGIFIPEDVMICGVGDSKIGSITAVTLTSAHFHYKTSGEEAAKMLLDEIKKRNAVPRILRLDFQIIERESTDR